MPRESPCAFEAKKTMSTIFGSLFRTRIYAVRIFLSLIEVLSQFSCWFDSFNFKFLNGMKFNHWEPNLSWNALNLFTSVGSRRKIKSAISLSKNGCPIFLDFNFRSHFNLSKFKPRFTRIIIGSIHMLQTKDFA